jgi:alpha-amylase/alpha-mannosidase (GH57 family)
MRDLRDDYDVPMFIKNVAQLQSNYYIDKIVNPAAMNYNKDWTQLTSFRDKYLVVRLIFDNFADVRLTFNFSALAKQQSER